MVQRHESTPAQRAQVVAQMIAHAGDYGVVTQLSRQLGVSRPTLYTWTELGSQALQHASNWTSTSAWAHWTMRCRSRARGSIW